LLLLILNLILPASVALGAPPGPSADDLRFTYTGALAAIDSNELRLTLDDGSSLAFKLSPDTRVAWPGVRGASLSALSGGLQVRVTIERLTPQSEWQVVRVRVLDQAGADRSLAGAPLTAGVSAVAVAYTEAASLSARGADGATSRYALTAQTRILPAGQAAPAEGDRVLLLFKPGDTSQVWAIVVLPNTRRTPGWNQ
jgi:hypothetical protein